MAHSRCSGVVQADCDEAHNLAWVGDPFRNTRAMREPMHELHTACMTASRLSSGSPIPMKTTLATRRPRTCTARATCATISSANSDRKSPSRPVSQKAHPYRQPTCEDTQSDHASLRADISITSDGSEAATSRDSPSFVEPINFTRDLPGAGMITISNSSTASATFTLVLALPARQVAIACKELAVEHPGKDTAAPNPRLDRLSE
eukprot:scaffold68653_cov33-Tisochrysis_lutea.AAC.1